MPKAHLPVQFTTSDPAVGHVDLHPNLRAPAADTQWTITNGRKCHQDNGTDMKPSADQTVGMLHKTHACRKPQRCDGALLKTYSFSDRIPPLLGCF